MMKHKTKQLVLLVVVLNLCALGLYSYVLASVRASAARIDEASTDLQYEIEREERIKRVEDVVQMTDRERDALKGHFLNEDAVVEMIEILEEVMQRTDALFAVSSVAVEEGETRYLNLTATLEGSETVFNQALEILETFPFTPSIEEVALNRSADEEVWKGTIALQFILL